MIKHIIAGISTLLAVWAWVYLYSLDKEVDKLNKIADLIERTKIEVKTTKKESIKTQVNTQVQSAQTSTKSQDDEMEKKLRALKEKAGNIAAFEVSPLYKKKCSSCHGSIGEGIIGPKLLGQDKEKVLQALKDFKSGKRKNYVMYGLLGSLSDQQLEDLAQEVSTFKSKLEASKNN